MLENFMIGGAGTQTLIFFAIATATINAPLVRLLYKPSNKYIVHKNRTIQNAKPNAELGILVCVYNEDNVPAIINLLEASSSTPLLISHQPQNEQLRRSTTPSTPSDRIISCFRIYEKRNHGVVSVYAYTAMTPFVSAHNDICTMALDNKAFFMIVPFHKQWDIDGAKESSKCRNVNQKVIDKAPCSVGILIDRGRLNQGKSVVSCWEIYIVGVIFLGGADDREALYYARRMAQHPNIQLTVNRFIPFNNIINDVNEKVLDGKLINEYRLDISVNEENMYREHVVKDGFEIVSVIRSMENSYNLVVIGRQQDNYLPLFSGLAEWNEYQELGFFGDITLFISSL